jgi:diguanylate cyclase (GGDEF)-like protein
VKIAALAAAIFIAAMSMLWWQLRLSEGAMLRASAEHAAVRWAELLGHQLAAIDSSTALGAAPSGLGTPSRPALEMLQAASEIRQATLHGPDGSLRQRLKSPARPTADIAGQPAPAATLDPLAAEVAGTLVARAFVVRGAGKNQPTVLGWAYAPIRAGTLGPGVLRVDVDLDAQAALIRAEFVQIVLGVGAMSLCLGSLALIARRRLERAREQANDHLRHLASHDSLTGIANRTRFREVLERACVPRGRRAQLAVMCIDLDGFKSVNDSLGHAIGDELLRQVAGRLSALLRVGDQLARLGGDEFALLQNRVTRPEDVAALATRITATLAEPFEIDGHLVLSGASVGAAVHGIDADDAESLMLRADAALYVAKGKGRGSWAFFDPQLEHQRELRRQMIQALRGALAGGELTMDFQPLYESDGRGLRGYEALARWHHPTLGTIPPGVFVPLAEEAGLVIELGNWALRHACRQAVSWPGELSVAVNLSTPHFRDAATLVAEVSAALSESGLPPFQLEIEITESLLIGDTENALRCLHALHELGVHVALDDFGTGFSSLAYLWRFPFDKVKIDRMFTQALGGDDKVNLIVKSIVSLAHDLNIRVNAEGIETEAQMQLMREYGCDELQGFLLGRPGRVDVRRQSRGVPSPRPFAARSDFASLSTMPAPLTSSGFRPA